MKSGRYGAFMDKHGKTVYIIVSLVAAIAALTCAAFLLPQEMISEYLGEDVFTNMGILAILNGWQWFVDMVIYLLLFDKLAEVITVKIGNGVFHAGITTFDGVLKIAFVPFMYCLIILLGIIVPRVPITSSVIDTVSAIFNGDFRSLTLLGVFVTLWVARGVLHYLPFILTRAVVMVLTAICFVLMVAVPTALLMAIFPSFEAATANDQLVLAVWVCLFFVIEALADRWAGEAFDDSVPDMLDTEEVNRAIGIGVVKDALVLTVIGRPLLAGGLFWMQEGRSPAQAFLPFFGVCEGKFKFKRMVNHLLTSVIVTLIPDLLGLAVFVLLVLCVFGEVFLPHLIACIVLYIGGVYLREKWAYAFYVLEDNPALSAFACIRRSFRLTLPRERDFASGGRAWAYCSDFLFTVGRGLWYDVEMLLLPLYPGVVEWRKEALSETYYERS